MPTFSARADSAKYVDIYYPKPQGFDPKRVVKFFLERCLLVTPGLSKWSFPASLVPPWCLAGCQSGPFLPPWCLPGASSTVQIVLFCLPGGPWCLVVTPGLSKWSSPASLVPPWCFAGCPINPFLPPWCLPGCPTGPFLFPLVPPWCFPSCRNGPWCLPGASQAVQLVLSCLPGASRAPLLTPWCLPGCPIGPFLPPWCLPGASQAMQLVLSCLPGASHTVQMVVSCLPGASLVPPRLSTWSFPASCPHGPFLPPCRSPLGTSQAIPIFSSCFPGCLRSLLVSAGFSPVGHQTK